MIIFLWKFTIFKLLSRGYSIYLNWPPFINAYFNKPCYDSKTIIFINFGKTKSKIGKKGEKGDTKFEEEEARRDNIKFEEEARRDYVKSWKKKANPKLYFKLQQHCIFISAIFYNRSLDADL